MSRKLKAGTHKLGFLIADMREGYLKQYTQEKIPDSLIKKAYNEALMTYYDLSGIKNTDVYTDKVDLPIVKKVYSNASVGSSYDNTTQVLTLPLEADDIIWTDSDGFDEDWEGVQIIITKISTGVDYPVTVNQFIENLGGFTRISVIPVATAPPAIAAADLLVQGETSADKEIDEIDLTRYVNYKRIDKIIKMVKSVNVSRINKTTKLCIGPPVIRDSREFEGMKESHKTEYSNFKGDIIWFRFGEILERSKGYSVTTYGDCVLELTLFPAVMEENEDYLDCPDVDKPSIDKIALVKVFSYMRKEDIVTQLPADVMNYYQELTGSKSAKAEEKAS